MISRELNLRIGDILIEQGLITREQLENALKEQEAHGIDQKRIGSYLTDLGYASEKEVMQALGIQFNLPVISLDGIRIKSDILDLVPESMTKKFNIIPLFKIANELTLAISDPTDINLMDVISSVARCKVVPVMAPYSEIAKTIEKYYIKKIETAVLDSGKEALLPEISRAELDELKKAGVEMPTVKIVDRILLEAVEDGASDIHIEPREKALFVRFRKDGILHDFAKYPSKNHPGIVSRIKIMAALDIAERQKPQDGRIQIKIDEKEIDIRVSVLPAYYGEKVVMRLLNRSSVKVSIGELGFSERNLGIFQAMIKEPYGIILVTGPTGSGKTTTLYAALNEINSVEKNIITVEDPVEYQIPIINQVQIKIKKDLTFANALRSILRQDPDIIMIGEIRDPETASIAAEAALTGHLVFSTLHTNDSPSAITRLVEMGVEPFLLAPTVLGIIAQRLARKICPDCSEEYKPSISEMNAVGLDPKKKEIKFFRGAGCDRCRQTGYKGRIGIHEILLVNDKIRELITNRAPVGMIRDEAVKEGFKDMRFDGLKKVIGGQTTVEELVRVTKNTS